MKVLLTGSDGFVGSVFCWVAREAGEHVVGTSRNPRFTLKGCQYAKLDIADKDACLNIVKAFAPDAIIHCVRYTVGLGQCEKERETAFKINALGTRYMVKAAEGIGAPFAYISTDWIFSGKKPLGETYNEEDEACPLNYYGVTKWAGEQEVEKAKVNWLILRPANIYGVHGFFLESPLRPEPAALERSSWVHKIITRLQQGEEIWLADTLNQSPVFVNQLAEVTLRLLREGKTGIYNVGGGESTTRYQFTRKAAEVFGLNQALVVKGTLRDLEENWGVTKEFSGIMPLNTSLNVKKVEKALGIKMISFTEGLTRTREFLSEAPCPKGRGFPER